MDIHKWFVDLYKWIVVQYMYQTHENQTNWYEIGEVFPWKYSSDDIVFTINQKISKLHINDF